MIQGRPRGDLFETSAVQHLMRLQIICVELNLPSDFDTLRWVSTLFQWLWTISKPVLSKLLIVGRLYIHICWAIAFVANVTCWLQPTLKKYIILSLFHSGHAQILCLWGTVRASLGSPCCCMCWYCGDYLREWRAARIDQRKIMQCAHRKLW